MYDKKRESILKVSRPELKEKMNEQSRDVLHMSYDYNDYNEIYQTTITSDYTNKHRRKRPQPLGPKASDVNFMNFMGDDDLLTVQFYSPEESSITNIISANEAYITHSIAQTAFLEKFASIPVNVTSSFYQVDTQYITTDGDRVHVDQTTTGTLKNAPTSDMEYTYKTDYTANFKNGRCVQETEKVEKVIDRQTSEWAKEYLKTEGNSTGTTSIRNELAPTYGVRPGVAVDEHTQSMLDLLNRPTAVRVVVSGQEKRPISKVKRSAHEQE